MKCWYHAPEKCDTVEDVLDHDKGGHCWACSSTTPGHSEMAPAKLGTGGITFKEQMKAEKLWKKMKMNEHPNEAKAIYTKLAAEAKRLTKMNKVPDPIRVGQRMKNGRNSGGRFERMNG